MNETYIKEFIIDGGFLNPEKISLVEEKMFESELSFLSSIVELNLLDKKTLDTILALLNGIPKVDLKNKSIELETFLLIPEPIVRTKKIVPFKKKEGVISVAVSNTEIEYDFIRSIIPRKYNFEIFLAEENDINKKIAKYQKALKDGNLNSMIRNLSNITKLEDLGYKKKEDLPKNYFDDIANDHYTEKFVKELLEYAETSKASHIYITNGVDKNLISFRIYGHNYPIMEVQKNTILSVSLKLKQLCDVNIFNQDEIIQNANFRADLNGKIENIFLSFVSTIYGESITLELGEKKDFGTEFITLVDSQKDIMYKNLNDEKGFYIISGEKQSGKTKTAYALMEYEVAKNREIYSVEDDIPHRINFVNQLLVRPEEKKNLLLAKIIQNKPDMVFIEHIKPYLIKILFNYVNFGGKVILGIKNDTRVLVDHLFKNKFKNANIIRNFNIILEHKKFQALDRDNLKKLHLTREYLNILNTYILDDEILELLHNQKLISKNTKIKELVFYTKNKRRKSKRDEVIFVRGVCDLGLTFESAFSQKASAEKTKVILKQAIKKSVIENALILSLKGEVDLKDILKYLTKA
jgi:type IV secretory pathway ATPase VirB11/archaellum biosynthesis ATPase